MKYNRLGDSGLVVSKLCFGGGSLGVGVLEPGKKNNIDQKLAGDVIGRCLDSGVTFYDTSDFYLLGQSEILLGKALGARRKDIVLATKVGLAWGPPETNKGGLSTRHIIQACDDSLKRLGTDWLDILYCHSPDKNTPLEETARAFEYIIRTGRARYVGVSNYPAWMAARFQSIQSQGGYAPIIANQVRYSMMGRGIERELVPYSKISGLGIVGYQALAGGFLTGKFTRENPSPPGARRSDPIYDERHKVDLEKGYDLIAALQEIGSRHSATVAQVVLAWTMNKPQINSVIFGVSRAEQADENIVAANLTLSDEDVARIDKLTALAD